MKVSETININKISLYDLKKLLEERKDEFVKPFEKADCDCSEEHAAEIKYCGYSQDCKYVVLLKGELGVKIILETYERQVCEICGKPADWKITFLLTNYRSNPRSNAYGRDDCSWISDLELFACEEHKEKVAPKDRWNYASGTTKYPIKNFPHMGLETKRTMLMELNRLE